MKTYLVKTPDLITRFSSNRIWNISTDKKEIYLTFDDGPIPEVTPWVLKTLKEFSAKATFFCVGENINKHPEIFQKVLANNHKIGNHTFNHLNGWKTNTKTYLENIEKANNQLQKLKVEIQGSKLFRPPYGKIKPPQTKALIKKGYKIIMWDILSGDFDIDLSKEKCLQNVIKNTQKGSIIVFHDHEKAYKKLQYVLPRVLEFYSKKGFVFNTL